MPSLSQLLTNHDRLLVLDAASTSVQVGLLQRGSPALWHSTPAEAGTGIFVGIQGLLTSTNLKLEMIDAFLFCEGPGSMLGTRTVAMAIRTWQTLVPRPAYAYQSLAVAAHFEWSRRAARSFILIADARRETWHCQSISSSGQTAPLERRAAVDLPAGELVSPASFRAWAQPPRPVGSCGYELAEIFPSLADADFFRLVESPNAFQHDTPEYKKWSAQVHSSATTDIK